MSLLTRVGACILLLMVGCARLQTKHPISEPVKIDPMTLAERDEITAAKHDRQWLKVINLQKSFLARNPNAVEAALDLIESYVTIEFYDQAIDLNQDLLRKSPGCVPCHVSFWNALREKENRSADSLKIIAGLVENFEKTVFDKSLQDHWFALYQGYQMTGESKKERHALDRLLTLAAEQGFSNARIKEFLASQFYVDFLRGQPTITGKKFTKQFSDFSQIDLIYQMELNRRVAKAQKSFFKYPVIKWSNHWLRHRPDSRRAHFASANAFRTLGIKKNLALEYLDKTLWLIDQKPNIYREPLYSDAGWGERLKESRHIVLTHRAWFLHLQGRSQEALQECEMITKEIEKEKIRDPQFYFYFGRIAQALEKKDLADKNFLKALDFGFDPTAILPNLKSIRGNSALSLNDLRDDLRQELWGDSKSRIEFSDITEKSGFSGFAAQHVAFGDFDADGDDDLLLGGGPNPGLLENKRSEKGDLVFENVWEKYASANILRFGSGIFADVDKDGDLDLLLTMALSDNGEIGLRLLINQINEGKGFVEKTDDFFPKLPTVVTAAAAFGDLNGDGYPDLYVANFEKNGEPLARGTQDFLLLNVNGKKFREVAKEKGVVSVEPMCGRGVAWCDFDQDGKQDIFVANYRLDPNFLFKNRGEHFIDVAQSKGVRGNGVHGNFGHSIGGEWGDINNDHKFDLVVGNLAHPRSLAYSNKTQVFIQREDGSGFDDTFLKSGIAYLETHSDPSLGDLDNDGDLDLILTAIYPNMPTTVYQNLGNGTFEDVTFRSGIAINNTWGGAFADLDRDGDLDFVVASTSGTKVYQNNSPKQNFLQVCVVDTRSPSIGSFVQVTQEGRKQFREVQGGKGTGNQHSLCVAFGLGSSSSPVDLLVRFPGGSKKEKKSVKPNQVLTVER